VTDADAFEYYDDSASASQRALRVVPLIGR
jgi:hypothetical protein